MPESKEIEVLQCFAEKGPLTGYDLHSSDKAIISNAGWEKIRKRMIDQELIREVPFEDSDVRAHREKKYYWLTAHGVLVATALGQNPRLLKKMASEIKNYKFSSFESLLLDFFIILGDNKISDIYMSMVLEMKEKGTGAIPFVIPTMLASLNNAKERQAFSEALRLHPELFDEAKNVFETISKGFGNLFKG